MSSNWLFLLFATLALLLRTMPGIGAELIRDGSFEVGGDKQLPASWTLSGSVKSVGFSNDHAEGNISLKLDSMPGQTLRLAREIDVEPRTEYLFTAAVKSDDRVVVTARTLPMSYHKQGQWQTLCGMIRTGDETKIIVTFDLGGLTERKAPSAKIDAVSLRKLQRPVEIKRKFDASLTHLSENAKPAATIVYPSTITSYKTLAEQLQQAIAQKVGVTLPILSDVEATTQGPPVLKPELEKQNLILIGRLGINRAMWPAYNRFLDATDGYYPGGDGYVVRTAANVFRNGRNHVILGGSSDAGAARAVQRLIDKHLAQATEGALPWLLDVELQGAALASMKEHDALWTNNPDDAALPRVEPGYGTIRRWYENAIGYYWTGWDSYKQRSATMLQGVLTDKSYNHHYVQEWFARTIDMLDDGAFFSADEKRALDELLLSNFLDFLTDAGDGSWMTAFSPPYDSIQVVNRHQISPWMADLTISAFVADYFDAGADIAALADFRRSEKDAFLAHMAAERYDTSLPGGVTTEHEEELALSLLRYALEHDDYRLFETGNARRLPMIERINHVGGYWVRPGGKVDSALMFGALTSYYADGRYLTLIEKIPTGPSFMRRYIGGVRRYTPGAEVQPQNADALAGVQLPEMMPQRKQQLEGLASPQFAAVKFPPSRVFDFVSFRNGFEPDDDYVAITGLMAPGFIPGIILNFTSRGMTWLGNDAADVYGVPTDRYFDRNGVHVLRTDRFARDEKPYPAAAQLVWSADFAHAGGVGVVCDPFVGTRWQRDLVWVRPGLFVVRDQLTAKQNGTYEVAINWRPSGGPSWDGTTWTSVAQAGHFRLTPLGEGFDVQQNVKAFLAGDEDKLHFRHTASRALTAGQSLAGFAVLQALHPQSEPALIAQLAAPNVVHIGAPDNTQRAIIAWSPGDSAIPQVKTDAQVLVLNSDGVQLIGGTRLEIAGAAVWQSAKPENQRIELSKLPGPAQSLLKNLTAPQTSIAASTAAPSAQEGWSAQDETAQWKQAWRYDALQQPLMVRQSQSLASDVVDFGRVVDIASILPPAITSGPWFVRTLPKEIWYTPGDDAGNCPPPESPLWKKIDQPPQWMPGARTGNYGETDRIEQDTQVLILNDVKARYVRTENAGRLVYMDRDRKGVNQSIQISLDSDRVLLKPHIWPKYVGWLPHWRDQIAVLETSTGKEIFKHTSDMKLLDVQLLPIDDSGKRRVTLATVDGHIQTLDESGKIARDLDLREMQLEFNRQFGRPNTRHPAGGFAMPFSIGTWRTTQSAAPGIVVGRYHAFSYIDNAGRLEGLYFDGSYVQPALLPSGIDFDGNGADEQICLARGAVIKIAGPKDQRVLEPNGALFYPQVYHISKLEEPAWDERLDGPVVKLFEPLSIGQSAANRPRYIAMARDSYFGIYDGLEHKWMFTWVPLVPLVAAGVIDDVDKGLRVMASTEDGLLWDMSFVADALDKPSKAAGRRFDDAVTRIATDNHGGALIAGNKGLYRLASDGASLSRLAEGSFVDVVALPDGAILTSSRDGTVQRRVRSTGVSPVPQ